MGKPGDRRQRWNEACGIGAFVLISMGSFLLIDGIYIGALFMFFMAGLELRDAKKGWKLKEERPPWADRHDFIDRHRRK